MEQQRAQGIIRVKSSVEYLCGLLQALGITCLSPELIRRAKFNHPSAAPPLLHALLHLLALFPSSSPAPPLSLPICNDLPRNSLQASLVSTSSSCKSELNNTHIDSPAHETKKKTKKKTAYILQSSHGFSSSSSSSSSLSSSSSSSDGGQGKLIHERDPPCKHSKVRHTNNLHLRQHRNPMPCSAQIKSGTFTVSCKLSNGKASSKDGIARPTPKYGNGKTLSQAVVLSSRAIEGMSVERYMSNEQYPTLPYVQEDCEVHNGIIVDTTLSLVAMAACNHDQHLSEETKERLEYVEFYMAQWGYPHTLPFLAIVRDAQQSRPLLLAMVWVLFRFDVFKRTLRDQLEPLTPSVSKASLPPYPVVVSQTRVALEMGKEAEENARTHMRKLLTSLDCLGDVKIRIAARTQQALILIGKVSGCIKNLHSLKLSKRRLRQELEDLQLEKRISHPAQRKLLSQYELHLLQHKEDLCMHLGALQAERVVTQKMRELRKHEILFQEWIESVVDLSVAEGLCNDVSDREIFDFKQQMSHRGEQPPGSACEISLLCSNGSIEGSNMLLSSSKDIMAKPKQRNAMETLDQNVSITFTAPILTQRQQNRSEREANGSVCSISEKIERLAQLALGVKQVLSSTHSRGMLPEALGAVLSERGHCLLGLEKDVKELVNSHPNNR